MIRRIDFEEILSQLDSDGWTWSDGQRPSTVIEMFGLAHDNQDVLYDLIAKWYATQISKAYNGKPFKLAGVATYLPQIAFNKELLAETKSPSLIYLDQSIQALSAFIRILNSKHLKTFFPSPLIEVVCGSTFDLLNSADRSLAASSVESYLIETNRDRKMKQVLHSLSEVATSCEGLDFQFACEVEPDCVYVLNDVTAIRQFTGMLAEFPKLKNKVSLNMDIAHMSLANAKPRELNDFEGMFSHSHFSDHASIHTRDRIPGTWKIVENWRSDLYGYLAVLENSFAIRQKKNLESTNAVAIELEGCGRIKWLVESSSIARYCLRMLDTWGRQIRDFHEVPPLGDYTT